MIVKSQIRIVANQFVRVFTLAKKGDMVEGHAHTFDHLTLLAKGTVLMRTQQAIEPPVEKRFTGPEILVTPKGLVHEFVALTDDCLLCCFHAIRNGESVSDIAPDDISEEEAMQLIGQFPLAK